MKTLHRSTPLQRLLKNKGNRMNTQDEILAQLKDILTDMFEIDAADITLDAELYDDLDIDSIDAVDLVVKLRDVTGKKISPEDFKAVRTVKDVVDSIEKLMTAED